MVEKKKSDVKMTRLIAFKIGKLLEAHCSGDGKYATYEEGWSDARVHAEANVNIAVASVSSLRHEMFGTIRKPSSPQREKVASAIQRDLLLLRLRIEALESWASRRPKTPFISSAGEHPLKDFF